MRDYKLINCERKYLLECPEHRIIFDDQTVAHQYKLALGLGTHPCPDTAPSEYQLVKGEKIKTYRPLSEVKKETDWADNECCKSGCPNCPWN